MTKLLVPATLLLATITHAQTAWTVTNFTDTSFATLETGGGFGPGVGSGASGDLRYVLFHAMATGGVNTITFSGCSTASPCTIVLGAPLPPIFETSNISSFSLTIDGGTQGAVILDGNSGGANTTTGALTTNRVFFVDNVAVTLKNLVIQNAKAQGGAGGGGSSNGGGGGAGFGAGLFVNQSTAAVVVQNTTFTNCSVVGGAGGNPSAGNAGGGGGGGLAFAGGNGASGSGGGGGGVSGAGASAPSGGDDGGSGGSGGGGGGINGGGGAHGGSAYADNASGVSGVFGGSGGFGGGGGGGIESSGNGGFGGGGGGSVFNTGSGGFGGGAGGNLYDSPGGVAPAVGGISGGTGGNGGGGGAAAGPAIFVVNGSVTLYNTTGSGFTATAGAAGGSGDGSTAGTSSAVPVFNYGGTVNGSTSVGPVYNAFTVTEPVGTTSATQTATLTFTTAVTSSNTFTTNVLTQGAANLDFKLVSGGTCASGTAYAVGATCTVEYSFTPTSPGIRYGGITLVSSGSVVASTLISGVGTGPQVVFNAPLTPSTLGGGFYLPDGVAVDGSGNVYISDYGHNAVKVMSNTCASSTCVTTLGGGFSAPPDVAVDGSGNVYISDYGNNAVKVMSNTCTSSTCVTTLGGGFSSPIGVAVDGSGNVYVADEGNNVVQVMSNTCTSSSCVSTLGGGFSKPYGVAVDGSGNVYVADTFNSAVKGMANTCTSSSCVSTLGGGFSYPTGVAVDSSGNVYVADTFNSAVKAMSNTCTSSSCVSTLGGGFNEPYGVGVDGSGNVYVADSGNNAVKVMARPTPPTVAFATTTTDGTTDTTDGTQTVTVQNTGNATLYFAIPGSGVTNPTTPHDFTFTTTSSSACPSLTSSASTTGSLAAGATCNIPLSFTPVSPASGALSESLIFTDTNLNATSATQSITLIGTAALAPYAVTHFNGYVTNIALGSTTTFLIFLGNPSSTVALSNVSATVTLPAGFSYAGSTGGSCNVTPSSSGSTVTLSGISLSAGGSCQNGISLTATQSGSQTVSTLPAAGTANGTAVTNTVTVYTPSSYTAPTEPVGTTSATQTAYLTFTTAVTSSNTFTTNVLTQGAANLDFKLVSGGTCASGTAYAIGATCTVEYSFTPTSPGVRYGGITLTSTSAVTSANPNGTVASVLLSGVGTGPQVVFNAPLTPSKLGGGLIFPYGVAVDGNGNVYFADSSHHAVKVMANTCTSSSCISTLGGFFFFPTGVAVDGSGNVYVADKNNNAVQVMANTCTSSSCVTTLGGGFNAPFGVAVDGSGNVYVADQGNNAVKVMPIACTSSTCVTTLGGGFNSPAGVAVDGSGNVYVADEGNNAVKEMANTCTSSSCVSTLGRGFNNPYDVAVDGSGNVYVADTNNSAVKVMPNTCTSSACVTTLGSGFLGPFGVAVDGSGNVYVADQGNNAVKVMARATPPTVAFATTTTDGTTDTTDGTQTVTVQNIGNATLSFAIPGSGVTNPTTPRDFTFASSTSGACPSLTSSASTTGTLAAGAICTVPVTFTPVSPSNGALSESLIFTDNALNATSATQSITLIGTAAIVVPYAVTHFNGYVTNIALGTTTTFLIFLGNPSSTVALSNVSATVTLPAGFSYAGSTGGSCNVTPNSSGSTVTLSGISLAAGGSCQNGILLQATATGSQTVSTLPAAGTANGTAATTSVTVYTPTLTSLTVSGYGSPAILTEGSTVTVTALDQNGNVDTSFTGSVTLSSSDAKATLPGSYAFQSSDNGVHNFNVTLNTLGSQSITATSGSTTASQTGILVGDAVWVLGNAGNVVKLNSQGGSEVAGPATNASGTYGGVAMDNSGNVWSVGNGSSTFSFTNSAGSTANYKGGGGLNAPSSLAVDGAGYIWIANSGGNTVSEFNNSGSAKSSSNGYGSSYVSGQALSAPSAIAIDKTGGVWVTNKSGNTVTHIFGAAQPVVTPLSTATANGMLGTRP